MVSQFHDDILVRVQNDLYKSITIKWTGVWKKWTQARLCYVLLLAPKPLRMFFTHEDFQDCDDVSLVTYGLDGKLFILRRLQAISKVQKDMLDEFLSKECINSETNAGDYGSSFPSLAYDDYNLKTNTKRRR